MSGGVTVAEILHALAEHLELTVLALAMAIAIGVPLGVHLSRERFLATPVLTVMGGVQTIPSVALLGFLIPLLGIGAKPAVLALFLYALLPIVRNTYAGLVQVDPATIEAARGIGLRRRQILFRVEMPQALPVIMAGVRTSTVLTIGVATLNALIGAGGLGTFIFRGVSVVDTGVILAGAIPAALLALVLDALLAGLERWLTPAGLRKKS